MQSAAVGSGAPGAEQSEQVGLPRGAVAARAAAALERAIDPRKGSCAIDAHARERDVEGAALHQRLQHALVDALRIDARGEVEHVLELTVAIACLEDRFQRAR